jgi:hypothetical protein
MKSIKEILEETDFGYYIAENESEYLQQFFVDTRFWRQIVSGRYDIILGAKGSGKSAIYLSLIKKAEQLTAESNVIIVEAENPKGDAVFTLLNKATTNADYEGIDNEALMQGKMTGFWKLYMLTIMVSKLRSLNFKGQNFTAIESFFENVGLLPKTFSVNDVFNNVIHIIKKIFNPNSYKFPKIGFNIESNTITFEGIGINFEKYSGKDKEEGHCTPDELFDRLNSDLQKSKQNVWILLDRLDVAFIENKETEKKALKALFLTYTSMLRYEQIRCKIFLRDDIMLTVTYDGLREASHLEKMTNIVVDKNLLFSILMKRILANPQLAQRYNIDEAACREDETLQQNLFNSIFPATIQESGKEYPTFDWIIRNISDGNDAFTPREMIALFNLAKEEQIELLEMGKKIPDNRLFSEEAFKTAILGVSKRKFEGVLIAENPDMSAIMLLFKNGKAFVSKEDIEMMIKDGSTNSPENAEQIIRKLSDIGFLKKQNNKWWIPYLYQYELKITE